MKKLLTIAAATAVLGAGVYADSAKAQTGGIQSVVNGNNNTFIIQQNQQSIQNNAQLPASRIAKSGVSRLDKPGLWLSKVSLIQAKIGSSRTFTFRVYCPTGMMRDVSGGDWKDAVHFNVMNDRQYLSGVVQAAFSQACAETTFI